MLLSNAHWSACKISKRSQNRGIVNRKRAEVGMEAMQINEPESPWLCQACTRHMTLLCRYYSTATTTTTYYYYYYYGYGYGYGKRPRLSLRLRLRQLRRRRLLLLLLLPLPLLLLLLRLPLRLGLGLSDCD